MDYTSDAQFETQNKAHAMQRGHLRHLPFDRADYGLYSVPCQLLAATYGMTGIHYHVKLEIGISVSIAKKQLQELMSLGAFASIKNPVLETVPGGPGLSAEISISAVRSRYVNHYYVPLSEADIASIFSRHFVALPKSGPRKIYTFDEATGRGSNLNRIHGGAA
jgi:hypothetical protein